MPGLEKNVLPSEAKASETSNEMLEALKKQCSTLWWDSETRKNADISKSSFFSKLYTKRRLNKLIDSFSLKIQAAPDSEDSRKQWLNDIRSIIRTAACEVLHLPGEYAEIILNDGFFASTGDFIKKVREIDPSTDIMDLFQAIRNVWIMNAIQLFACKKISLTPSVYGYSMLYPYTDNLLDDPGLSEDIKMQFSNRLRSRLQGNKAEECNPLEEKIFNMIGQIESEYPRESYPEVYEGIMLIYAAQVRSLKQQSGGSLPYESDILGISIEKGGSSVLADGYLVNGRLSKEQAAFLFSLGAFLQLSDDLQDISIDQHNQHMTIYSQLAGKWPLDRLADRLLGFMDRVLEQAACFNSPDIEGLKALIRINMTYLIYAAVAKNKKFFTGKYRRNIEQKLPVSFSYLRRLDRQLGKKFKSLDNLVLLD